MQNPSKTANSKSHFLPMGIFLVFIFIITVVFLICTFRDVEKNTRNTLNSNIDHQAQNFRNIINQHFQYIEGIAAYIGAQEEITSEKSLELLATMSENSTMNRMVIIAPDGTGYYLDGSQWPVDSYDFFQKALGGERAFSKPVASNLDGELCIVLAAPILRDGEVVGVLGGSCKLSTLADMLLEDDYSGSGVVLITDSDGSVIAYVSDETTSELVTYKTNFFNQLYNIKMGRAKPRTEVISDLKSQGRALTSITYRKRKYYMAYQPLDINEWMLCYITPRSVARGPYNFITRYGVILCVTLVLGMSALLLNVLLSTNRTQTELLEMGQSDLLTGMLNKKSTEEMIQQWLDSEQRIGLQAFVMIDIDHFKEVNDTFGHAVGDEILRGVSNIIRQEFREGDILGRLGGDEFCILMKNIVSDTNAIAKVRKLHESIRTHTFKDMGENGHVTCSIGVSYAPMYGNSFEELYHTADEALYKTKKGGRDGFNIYDGKK